jgi:hypothetical protein
MNETVYGTVDMVGTGDYHYNVAVDYTQTWGLEAIDDRSGLETNGTEGYPFSQTITHDGVTPAGDMIGDDGYGTILSDNWVRNENATNFLGDAANDTEGIFVYVGYAVDRAGNMSEIFTYNWLVDNTDVPETTAITPTTTAYAVGQPAMFNVWGSDDLEVMELGFTMTYPTVLGDISLFYGAQALTGVDRWDDVFMNIVGSEQYGTSTVWGRIDFTDTDGAVPGAWVYLPGENSLPVDVTAEFTQDAGYNPGDGSTATWTFIDYTLGGWGELPDDGTWIDSPWPDVNLDFFTIEDTGDDYLVEQISDSSIDEFVLDAVLLAVNDGGTVTVCASVDGDNNVYSDNGTNRFYQWTFDYPDDGPCGPDIAVDASIHAVGVKGDALLVTWGGAAGNPLIIPNPGGAE